MSRAARADIWRANLGPLLGSRDPAHISRWWKSGVEARRNLPTCNAVTRAGSRCMTLPMVGHCQCRHHLRDPHLRAAAEAEREARYRRTVDKGYAPRIMDQARKGLASIARRRLHLAWKIDPRLPGSTITFPSTADREKTRQWLIVNCFTDPDAPLPSTGRMPTARCLDRLLWAGWRIVRTNGAASDEMALKAGYRVASAIRDDEKFWKRWEAAGGEADQ